MFAGEWRVCPLSSAQGKNDKAQNGSRSAPCSGRKPSGGLFLRDAALGLVDAELAAHDLTVVEVLDGDFGFLAVGHLDKAVALGLAASAVADDAGRLDDAEALELLAELVVGHGVAEVSDVDLDGLAAGGRGVLAAAVASASAAALLLAALRPCVPVPRRPLQARERVPAAALQDEGAA